MNGVEEKMYFQGLKNTGKTNKETLEMEYMQKLVNLSASQYMPNRTLLKQRD
jgi:hypothetical protein